VSALAASQACTVAHPRHQHRERDEHEPDRGHGRGQSLAQRAHGEQPRLVKPYRAPGAEIAQYQIGIETDARAILADQTTPIPWLDGRHLRFHFPPR
jgi:hypothetical protein